MVKIIQLIRTSTYLLLLLNTANVVAQDVTVRGTVISSDGKTPVSYCSIFEKLHNEYGTITDEKGAFSVDVPAELKEIKLIFSCLGFRDTTLTIQLPTKQNITLSLTPQVYKLAEIIIRNRKFTEFVIGSKNTPLLKDAKGNLQGALSRIPGMGWGVFVKKKNKMDAEIKSISIYLNSHEGFYETPFTLRVMRSDIKIEQNRMYSRDHLQDILIEKLRFTPDSPGWFDIDLSDYQLPFDNNGIFIVIIPLRNDKNYYWDSDDQFFATRAGKINRKFYGSSIGMQKLNKQDFSPVMYNSTFGIIDDLKTQLAIEVHYLAQKK